MQRWNRLTPRSIISPRAGRELDLDRFVADRVSDQVLRRIAREISSGRASREVAGTPRRFIDGAVHRGSYDASTLQDALA